MRTTHIISMMLIAAPLVMGSCGSKKAVADMGGRHTAATGGKQDVSADAFVYKVADNKVYATNIVGNASITIQGEGKDISVPGAVRMRRDQVIRLQVFIPLLGTEVGRIEFTPQYVLVIDRMHKEYVKADYTQVDFLKANGLNFYSLQALFWNELFLPGEQKVKDADLRQFSVSSGDGGAMVPLRLDKGSMSYVWKADRSTGRIGEAEVAYKSQAHGTSALNWQYSGFTAVGVKQFPATQTFRFTTTATQKQRSVSLTFKMNSVKTNSDWDATTEVSPKYKRIETSDILKKLLQL